MIKVNKNIIVTYVMAVFFVLLTIIYEGNSAEVAGQGDLCTTHQLPVVDCFICDPTLRESGRLWCKEHERYEDRCFICHPDLKDENRLWCDEHNLYEDECIFCHPELKKKPAGEEKETAATDHDSSLDTMSTELQCEEHGVLENECGICHPELADLLKSGQSLKVRFESKQSAKKAGIMVTKPLPADGSVLSDLSLLCRVTYNQNQFAQITPLARGVIQRVLVDVGETITKGEVLAEIMAPEIANTKSEYLMALSNRVLKETVYKRKKGLWDEKIVSQRDYELASTEYDHAKSKTNAVYQQLVNYGLNNDDITKIETSHSTSSILQVIAPFSGTITNRNAVVGENVQPGDTLFMIADLSTMWLDLSIPEDRISHVSVGDTVEATFDILPHTRVQGKLTWISAGIDEQTRMLKGRAVVPNPEMKLKHAMFGQVGIKSKRSTGGLYVPVESIHQFGPERLDFVFTRLADDLFEVRRVDMGAKNGDYVEILNGLNPEDQIVVAHSFTVKSEFLKARLGAGCVDD